MKKKTVITTEKHEVWIVREGIPQPNQPIDTSDAMDIVSAEIPEESEAEILERNEDQ
ncbi:MAG TPA: hypothetical protein VLQ90_08390 [Pyrinomonadaceae bacterium]|nr:hypothetical protein [Pyrinomonadaceae bacterium]